MKITKSFNRVIKPLKPTNCSTSNPKPQIIKVNPNLKPKSKTKPRTIKQKPITQSVLNSKESIPNFVLEKSLILSPDFYQIDALHLAPRLLGKYLKRDDVILQITEVHFIYPMFPDICDILTFIKVANMSLIGQIYTIAIFIPFKVLIIV